MFILSGWKYSALKTVFPAKCTLLLIQPDTNQHPTSTFWARIPQKSYLYSAALAHFDREKWDIMTS